MQYTLLGVMISRTTDGTGPIYCVHRFHPRCSEVSSTAFAGILAFPYIFLCITETISRTSLAGIMVSYAGYLKAAFTSQINLLALAGVGMISLISGNPVPLFIGLVGEAVWLGVAPLLPAYRNMVDGKRDRHARIDAEAKTRETLRSLPPELRAQSERLERMARDIRQNYSKYNESSKLFLDRLAGRFDDMVQRHARMLNARHEYERHFSANSEVELRERLDILDAEMSGMDGEVRNLKARQRDILAKRLERLEQAQRDYQLLKAQIATLEEMMALLKEQALTMRRPEEMTEQLNTLMGEIEVTEHTVSSLEASFENLFDRELDEAERQLRLGNE